MVRENKMIQHRHEDLSKEEEERLSDLFNRLDVNKDGKIDMKDLTEAWYQLEVPTVPGQAQKLFDKYDRNSDGHIEFVDFVQYVLDHEKKLRLSFHDLDHNQDGFIDADEIMMAFKKLGVSIDPAEANKLLKRMDKDETLLINWNEWRDYLLFHPSSDISDIVHYWRHAMTDLIGHQDESDVHLLSSQYHINSIIDVGEDTLVPDDFTETEMQTGMWWRHLVAGGAAGAVSRTCTAPLDRLKVLLQVSDVRLFCHLQAHGSRINNLGIRSGFIHMLNEGGLKSLWRGNGINVLKIAPETALKFAAYEQIKRLFKGANKHKELGPLERFVSGSLAGAISQSVIYPMEVLKTRLALRKTGQYHGISDCAQKIYHHEGIKSFYRGYVPNLIGIIPYAGIDLCVYETLKRLYTKHRPGSDPGILVLLACGTTSSTCGQLTAYPLALIRTKLQAKIRTDQVVGKADTMVGLFQHIVKTEGPLGLYRGITPNFMKVIPAVSISYVVYEHFRKFLGIEMT